LAEKTGITHVTIANIESEKSVVTIDYFFKIIEALGYVLNIKKI
jgi:transcriptional regulator with XRE-family HTH domain